MKDIYRVIQTIKLTEKSAMLQETANSYVFKVDRRANKLEIKQAVETIFGAKVASVNTCNYQGKKRRERRSDFGRTPHWKKAIVRLRDGESIDLA